MAEGDTPVVLDDRVIYDIEERSDFDRDMTVKAKDLGEDWGDGFFVQEEPVLVTRNKDGSIASLRELSDIPGFLEVDEDAEPVQAEPVNVLHTLPRNERDKLVTVLATRLVRWYKNQPPRIDAFNPIYDGIPEAPPGSPDNIEPLPGTHLYPASEQQVFDWIKTHVIGPRVQLINKRRGFTGFARDYAVRITKDPLD